MNTATRRLVALVVALVLAYTLHRSLTLTLLALLVVVTIHEAGHYLAARILKLHTPEFSVGLGPVVLQRRNAARGMDWSLRAIPLGGFVKIAGMEEAALSQDPALPKGKRAWSDLNRGQRVFLAAAGPFANMILAVVLVMVVLIGVGTPQLTNARITPLENSPAQAAGLREGDVVVAVDSLPIQSFSQLREVIATLPINKPVGLDVMRNEKFMHFTVTTKASDTHAVIGVSAAPTYKAITPAELVSRTTSVSWKLVTHTASGLAQALNAITSIPANFISGENSDAPRLLSPVGAAKVAESASREDGWYAPLLLLANASMFIGAFNLLPVPPLDGGHIAIASYEAVMTRVRRRQVRISTQSLLPVTRIVITFILLLSVSSLVLDVFRPIVTP